MRRRSNRFTCAGGDHLTRSRRGLYHGRRSPADLEHVQNDKEVLLFWAHRLGDLKLFLSGSK